MVVGREVERLDLLGQLVVVGFELV